MHDKLSLRTNDFVYVGDDLVGEFRQGEIISGLTSYIYDPIDETITSNPELISIVITQDCDLQRYFENRENVESVDSPSVILARLGLCEEVKKSLGGSDIWKRVKGNRDERYQVLEGFASEFDAENEGLKDLIVDFRELFSLTDYQMRSQITMGNARRRTRLLTPFREHFQTRLAFYLSRVSLEVPHQIAA